MYKTTADSAHFLPRTGSHSTKGSRNGRVDILPAEAEEALYGNFRERRDAIVAKLEKVNALLAALREERATKLCLINEQYSILVQQSRRAGRSRPKEPPALADWERRFHEAKRERGNLEDEIKQLNQIGQAKGITRTPWEKVFVDVAEALLDTNTFERLRYETDRRIELSRQKEALP